jgi:hypothetical protein
MDEYNKRTLYPRFLKCYHHLHSIIEYVGCVDQIVMKILVWMFFNILHSQMNHQRNLSLGNYWFSNVNKWIPKDIKWPFQWWEKHETMFPTFGFLACQISSIIGSQIETEIFFSLAGIFTSLKRCCLQSYNFKTLNFEQKLAKWS